MKVFLLTGVLSVASVIFAADVPQSRLQSTTLRESNHTSYHWEVTSAGPTAQLLTLFCQPCQLIDDNGRGVPLVAVLRDTLGENNPETDRLLYVWLLSYARPNLGQRLLSAVPFFYWRVAEGSKAVSAHDISPLMDLTAPRHPVASEIGRDLLQWTILDPMTTPIRASSRAYRTNQADDERLHLEEAISYLRDAPVGTDDTALTETELNTVVARLELRKRLLGGLVSERRAARLGQEAGFEQERIRSRNWELLRQCADRTGLIFEPIDLAGNPGEYAILWFSPQQSFEDRGTALAPIWKLLNIRNPWTDPRLNQWHGSTYLRSLDENGTLVPAGVPGASQVQLIPLGVYSLSYPRLPLLLIDFRDKLHIRRHEMTQRTINEITAGVIGISHFTNWYYYVGSDLYDFVTARHGAAMDQAARLDCYSQFRVALALDHQLDPVLRTEMQRRVESLAVNPLEDAPNREIQIAEGRYSRLRDEIQDDGPLMMRLDKHRRSELAASGESSRARFAYTLLHDATLGLYTHRAPRSPDNLVALVRERRVEYELNFLGSLVEAGTQPEVAYDSSLIESSIDQLTNLIPEVRSRELRARATATLEGLKELSRDSLLQADCSRALLALAPSPHPTIPSSATGILTGVRAVSFANAPADIVK